MDESSDRVARVGIALASYPRLQLLWLVAKKGVVTPSMANDELGVHFSVAARHLEILYLAEIVEREYVGTERHYRGNEREGEIGGGAAKMVISLVKDADFADGTPEVARAIFSAATGFTYPRRVRICR